MLGSLFQKRPRRPPPENLRAVADNKGTKSVDSREQSPAPLTATGSGEVPHELESPGKKGLVDLLAELEANRKAAGEASAEQLTALRTEAWDGSQRAVHSLPADLQNDLFGIYADINLLNQLVWLSSEFQPAGPSLRSRYVSLSLDIAHRLNEVVRSPRF